MGDKTQLATLIFSAKSRDARMAVFLAAATALIFTTAVGVLAGAVVSRFVSPRALSWVAGVGFIAVGVWTLVRA